MAPNVRQQVRIWPFRQTPPEFRVLFPESGGEDWVAHVAEPALTAVERALLRWHRIYPVRSVVLPDGSRVYCGAPRQAMAAIAELGEPAGPPSLGDERRDAPRVRLECLTRYETATTPKKIGMGHTVDMSRSGISFTTESLLDENSKVTLSVAWPVTLEGDIRVELHAVGRLVRAEATRAALRLETMNFGIAN
jgi:hypothetical protein